MRSADPVLNALFYLACAGILYGSLFPFDFNIEAAGDALPVFLSSWNYLPGLGDILGNIALFIPFGLLAGLMVFRGEATAAAVVVAWLLVAVGSQLLQLFLPSRDPAIFDLYTNAAGAAIGWLLARRVPSHLRFAGGGAPLGHYLPLALSAAWLICELLPLVPSIDLQSYKEALKPLLLTPRFVWYESLLQAGAWFAALYLLESAGVRVGPARVLAGFAAVLLLKVVIVLNSVAVTDVVAMALAFAAWCLPRARSLDRSSLATILLLLWLADGLLPFSVRAQSQALNWIPFAGFLEGSMLTNVIALCRKGFVFGVLAYLLLPERGGWQVRALVVAFLLLALEIAQMFLRPGYPEVTDPLLFLAIAWLVQGLRSGATAPVFPAHAGRDGDTLAVYPDVGHRRVFAVVGVYVLLVSVALKVLLGLPGVPYNVIELFRFGANGVDLVFFALAMLSLGWGGAWLGRVFVYTRRPVRGVFLGFCTVASLSFILLWVGVTQESVKDIVGGTVFVHRVTEWHVLGEPGARLFEFLGPQNVFQVTKVLEPIIRFAALFAPLFIFFALLITPLWRLDPGAQTERGPRFLAFMLATLCGLLFLGKVIAFDWSSTDNLNELIARDGEWGWGGGGYLYLLVLVLSTAAAYLVSALRGGQGRLILAVVAIAASLPLTWWLLNNGLGKEVHKYGRIYSGVDFFLGPDRDNLISRDELFLRWTGVHVVAIVGLAFSATLCLVWFGRAKEAARMPEQSLSRSGRESSHSPLRSPIQAPLQSPGEPSLQAAGASEFHLYREQATFLLGQSRSTDTSVSDIVNNIVAYFGRELAASPGSVDTVRGYLVRRADSAGKVFAQRPVQIQLTGASREVLATIDPDRQHSESRLFRKLLEIFMEAAAEERDKPDGDESSAPS